MINRSTRSNTDLSTTSIDCFALNSIRKQKQKPSMEPKDESGKNRGDNQCVEGNQRSYAICEESKDGRGHESYDQHHEGEMGKLNTSSVSFLSMEKFNGEGDAENWLKQIIMKLDSLQFSTVDRYNLILEILIGDALIWYVKHQQKMSTFVTFLRLFIHQYGKKQVDVSDSTAAVVTSLRNQMLLNSLEKLEKFSGRNTQNVSSWLREIEQSMHLWKLTDSEKFFFISSCLQSDARDWYFDNVQSITKWEIFVQKFIQTFESSGKADISFNRLRHYEQGLNQNDI